MTVSMVELSPAADAAALAGLSPVRGAGGQPADGGFQALLGALLGQPAGENMAAMPPTEGPTTDTTGPKDDGETAAAALESLAALAWMPVAPVQPAPATLVTATREAAGEGTIQGALGVDAAALPPVPGQGTGAVPAEPGEPVIDGPASDAKPQQPPSEATVTPAAPQAAMPAPSAVAASAETPAAGDSSVITRAAAAAGTPERPSGTRRTTGLEPTAAETESPEFDAEPAIGNDAAPADGVVRSDGNAMTTVAQPAATSGAPAPDVESDGKPATEIRAVEAPRAGGPAPLGGAEDAAPVTEARQAPPPAPTEQVARAVIERVTDGGGEAVIRLDPAELGHVRIHVSTSSDGVRVEVHAERPEAVALLRNSTPDLTALLSGQGLDLTNVYVGLGGREAGGGGQDGAPWAQRGQQPRNGEFASILGIGDPGSVERHNRLRSAYNPDGALLYRI